MRITAINLHPVKSGAIRPVQRAPLDPAGLRGDRTWMVVDADGAMVSARTLPVLFRIVADTAVTDPTVTAGLRLRSAGHPDLELHEPADEPVQVHLFSMPPLTAVPAGAAADDWVRSVTGRSDLRLVWCHDPGQRRLNPEYSTPTDHAAFQDGYPVTLASESSLARLNEWIGDAAPLTIDRFRPNIVVDGEEPFDEDGWARLRLGAAECRVAKGVDRCDMTTIDLTTLDKGLEPIRTLARHRRRDGKTWFACHLIPDVAATIAVGDEVEVLERR